MIKLTKPLKLTYHTYISAEYRTRAKAMLIKHNELSTLSVLDFSKGQLSWARDYLVSAPLFGNHRDL